MTLPSKLPGFKDLVPYLVVAILSGCSALWLRLGERDASCDKRVEQVEKLCEAKDRAWQARYDRQEARIDEANKKIEIISREQIEYFKMLSKLKKQ